MELTKTFLERLQYLQAELRAIAQSEELRQMLQSEYCNYDPDLTIIDALHAVSEISDAYEQNYCIFHLQSRPMAIDSVPDYLDSLAGQHPRPDLTFLDSLASRYLGTNEPLHNLYLKKTLIAAVARIREPGCKHHTCTVLTGDAGNTKTLFWQHLFGHQWFSDELWDIKQGTPLQLRGFWCLEVSEVQAGFRGEDFHLLKGFITLACDTSQVNGSHPGQYPRRYIIVGSTNHPVVFSPSMGDRRFWIIPTQRIIPIDQLIKERDQIWAVASALYELGEPWWLTTAETELQQKSRKDLLTTHAKSE